MMEKVIVDILISQYFQLIKVNVVYRNLKAVATCFLNENI